MKERIAYEEVFMKNKMVFGILITVIGLWLSTCSFIYAALNPWNWNCIDGLLGSLIGTHMLIPLIIGIIVIIAGLVICFNEAYRK